MLHTVFQVPCGILYPTLPKLYACRVWYPKSFSGNSFNRPPNEHFVPRIAIASVCNNSVFHFTFLIALQLYIPSYTSAPYYFHLAKLKVLSSTMYSLKARLNIKAACLFSNCMSGISFSSFAAEGLVKVVL